MKQIKSFLQKLTHKHSGLSQDEVMGPKQGNSPVDRGETPPSEEVPDASVETDLNKDFEKNEIAAACEIIEIVLQSPTVAKDYAHLEFNYDDFPDHFNAELVLAGLVAECMSDRLELSKKQKREVVFQIKLKKLGAVKENDAVESEAAREPLDGSANTLNEEGQKSLSALIQMDEAAEVVEVSSVYSEYCSDSAASDPYEDLDQESCEDEEQDVPYNLRIEFNNVLQSEEDENSEADVSVSNPVEDQCTAEIESQFSDDYRPEKWSPWMPETPLAVEETANQSSSSVVRDTQSKEESTVENRKNSEENLVKDNGASEDKDFFAKYKPGSLVPKRILSTDTDHCNKVSRIKKWFSSMKRPNKPSVEDVMPLLGFVEQDEPETYAHCAFVKGEGVQVLAYEDFDKKDIWLLLKPLSRETEIGFLPASSVSLLNSEELPLEVLLEEFKIPKRCCFWQAQTEIQKAMDEFHGVGYCKSHFRQNLDIFSDPSNWKNLARYLFAKQYPYLGIGKRNYLAHKYFKEAEWEKPIPTERGSQTDYETPGREETIPTERGSQTGFETPGREETDAKEETGGKKSVFNKGFKRLRKEFKRKSSVFKWGFGNTTAHEPAKEATKPFNTSLNVLHTDADNKGSKSDHSMWLTPKKVSRDGFPSRFRKRFKQLFQNPSGAQLLNVLHTDADDKGSKTDHSMWLTPKKVSRDGFPSRFRKRFKQLFQNPSGAQLLNVLHTDADDKGSKTDHSMWLKPKKVSRDGFPSRFRKRFKKLFQKPSGAQLYNA